MKLSIVHIGPDCNDEVKSVTLLTLILTDRESITYGQRADSPFQIFRLYEDVLKLKHQALGRLDLNKILLHVVF